MRTMRIARAEFIKIFKKPSIYVMGIILAIIILLASFFFSPTKRTDTQVTISGENVAEIVLNFETNEGSENIYQYNLKNTQAENMIDFYLYLNLRETNIETSYKALKEAYSTLVASQIKANYDTFKTAFENFKSAIEYGSAGQMDPSGYNDVFKYYFGYSDNEYDEITSQLFSAQEHLLSTIQGMYNSTNCSDEIASNGGIIYFCNAYTTNKYGSWIDGVYESALSFITYSCEMADLATTLQFKVYSTIVDANSSETLPAFPINIDGDEINSQTEYFNHYKDKFTNALTTLKTYLHKIITTSQPLILVSDIQYKALLSKLDNILGVLNLTSLDKIQEKASSVGISSTYYNTPLSLNQAKVAIIKKITGFPTTTTTSSSYTFFKLINSVSGDAVYDFGSLINSETSLLSLLDLNGSLFQNSTLARLSNEKVEKLSEITTETTTRCAEKLTDIESIDGTNGSLSTANTYISQYKHYNLISNDIVSNSIKLSITEGMSNSEVASLYGYDFDIFSRYSVNETLLKNQYLFDSDTFAFDYSDVFSFNQNSASEGTTIFDFIFFALRISTLFIIVFAILMAANLIANEFDTGTIKLLAIRPFKRGKIIMGKFWATMFFVICFVLFSTIVSLIAGLAMFEWNFQPVLAVFNSSVAFSINPLLLMFINVISVIIEIMFFAIIAITMSTITRSFAGTISTTLILYILSLGLNMLFSNNLWYAYSPFMNTDFFRFMGGAFASNSGSALSTMFITPLLKNMNFYISLGMYGGISLTLLFTTYLVFKKRDI